ncbi:MAG TPA: hypothetical protein VN253_28085 [Kofleriaceae bacterium]|nr:hypothetical protein [Kofleriaceae bacterium]
MTAAALAAPPPRAAAPRALPPFPTPAALALERASRAELELVMVRGAQPDLEALVGWEFRGINHPAWARLAGIKKFVKGFFRAEDGRVMGYNSPVVRNVLDGRWRTRPSDTAPRRFGFYEVAPVDPTRRDNTYLHALLLDYGRGGNGRWDPTSGLRDYLVQVDPANPDLFLGKAYYALGPLRVHSNYFILERFRRGLTDYALR